MKNFFLKRPSLKVLFVIALCMPAVDYILDVRFAEDFRAIYIYAILALGLNVITGLTGLLNLGSAAFMAIGAYTYAILTANIYPFQLDFWGGMLTATLVSAALGVALGIPTLRLRGDYLAIVTLGFGEIVQDTLRNIETITKGTQGINPLPGPHIFGWSFPTTRYEGFYYLLLGILTLLVIGINNLKFSRIGRAWIAVRDDELAAACMGINPTKVKLQAFALSAALSGLAGALWASYLNASGEPGNYDFQISVMILCIVIVGGLGSIYGVLFGSVLVVGFNSIILVKLTSWLGTDASNSLVILNPTNWKFLLFGLALILAMRYRPNGLFPDIVANDKRGI
jgi:branched-chain amino acid transport system permease protein